MCPFALRSVHDFKMAFSLIFDVWKTTLIKVTCKNHFLRFSGYIFVIIIAQIFQLDCNLRMS